jgi:crotonobetainyl-CoA:carnitine CoA-transferase CaiB-like acyl-CoA transferase
MITHQPVNNHDDLLKVVDGLLEEAGLDRNDLGGKVTFAGMDPIRPTVMKVGSASAAVVTANAIASALIWKMRSGEDQDIHVDLRKAYVTQSAWQDILADCTLINGVSVMGSGSIGGMPVTISPTEDGRFVLICPPYPSIVDRLMGLLDSGTLPHQIEQATLKWAGEDLE